MTLDFLINFIDYKLNILETKISGMANREKDIEILEWALCEPLRQFEKDPPTLNEIASEFGIEMVEFLIPPAEQLTTLGVLERIENEQYKLTSVGKKLVDRGKMVSAPREISFIIYKDILSKIWLTGVKNLPKTETITLEPGDENFPTSVPEIIINDHVTDLKNILLKDETILEYYIDNVQIKTFPIKIRFDLKQTGINLTLINVPFKAEQKKEIENNLGEIFVKGKELQNYIAQIDPRYEIWKKIQPHKLTENTQLFHLDKLTEALEVVQRSNPKYIIKNIQADVIEQLQRYKNEILIFSIYNSESSTVNIEIDTDGSVIAKKIHYKLNNSFKLPKSYSFLKTDRFFLVLILISIDGIEIPTWILAEQDALNEIKSDLSNLIPSKILEKQPDDKVLEIQIGKFYLDPKIDYLKKIIKIFSSEEYNKISNRDKLSNLAPLIELIKDLKPTPQLDEIEELIQNLDFKDLIAESKYWIKYNKKGFLNRFQELIEKNVSKIELTVLSTFSDLKNKILDVKQDLTTFNENISELQIDESTKKIFQTFDYRLKGIIDNFINNYQIEIKNGKHEQELAVLKSMKYLESNELFLVKIANEYKNDKTLDSKEKLNGLKFLAKENYNFSSDELKKVKSEQNSYFDKIKIWEGPSLRDFLNTFDILSNIIPNISLKEIFKEELQTTLPTPITKKELDEIIENCKTLNKKSDKEVLKQINQLLKDIDKNFSLKSLIDVELYLYYFVKLKNSGLPPSEIDLVKVQSDFVWKTINKILQNELANITNTTRTLIGQLGLTPKLKEIEKKYSKKAEEKSQNNKKFPLIIDGNNIAFFDSDNNIPDPNLLLLLKNQLTEEGLFSNIYLYVSAALKNKEGINKDVVIQLIRDKIIIETPAQASDDYFIIRQAIEQNGYILTNDQYNDWKEKYPDLKEEINTRRITFMLNPDKTKFIFGEKKELKEK